MFFLLSSCYVGKVRSMKMTRISWRDAVKKFRLGAVALHCQGCKAEDSEDWFVKDSGDGPYCTGCAKQFTTPAKILNERVTPSPGEHSHDAAASVTQFYTDTRGTVPIS